MNVSILLPVLVVMLVISAAAGGEPADTAIRQLCARHAPALRRYAERFSPDQASADDIVQETFYQGRTLAKVARQLEVPDSTARSRLHYALEALRRQMKDPEAIEPR
jgi:DNA-directed RNA polymerase specialized sigma24 family protein